MWLKVWISLELHIIIEIEIYTCWVHPSLDIEQYGCHFTEHEVVKDTPFDQESSSQVAADGEDISWYACFPRGVRVFLKGR